MSNLRYIALHLQMTESALIEDLHMLGQSLDRLKLHGRLVISRANLEALQRLHKARLERLEHFIKTEVEK